MSKVIARAVLKGLKSIAFEKLNLDNQEIYFTYQTDTKECVTDLIDSIEQTEYDNIQINIRNNFHTSIILTEDLYEMNRDRMNMVLKILDEKELARKFNSYQEVSLEEWINTHQVGSNMTYKRGADRMFSFFTQLKEDLRYKDWKCSVVSEHTSKSIVLPVLKFQRGSNKIYIRDNFHDYKLSVESNLNLNLPLQLINNDDNIPYCYCEGFSPEWVHRKYSPTNANTFTIEIQHVECYVQTILTLVSQQTWM
jgi:hypothetical protein